MPNVLRDANSERSRPMCRLGHEQCAARFIPLHLFTTNVVRMNSRFCIQMCELFALLPLRGL